ncbi:hypothetical protein QRO08_03830 [Paracidovorax citrulli]|uniref:Uncharacterized protein n=2 Tax=Paracidovorax citrulli TaxID=80869 RepID=A1TR62_PARC0|nr:hypothetical protein [Paracidovorax citrulli]ABM33450.1 hypothetical protein Aave_2882 [Paracidovorax citrulli AAC00-1]ABM34632.1 hypothetical protein Aave_4091 [Paracidovorax citrulli AAC00-1]ATG92641.1 hypothetical protein CQB05_00075 [Paracidovorax citrulli]ATG94074.1 hypothetical protein CQB05_08575 [Paracidovorax citrulli]MVT28110.1 hypothetical protein [Paracidovorax citrulli]
MITFFQAASGLNLIDASAEPTAQGAYQAHQANIGILLAALNDELRSHGLRAASQPRHRGFAGDLQEIQSRLEEMVTLLACDER